MQKKNKGPNAASTLYSIYAWLVISYRGLVGSNHIATNQGGRGVHRQAGRTVADRACSIPGNKGQQRPLQCSRGNERLAQSDTRTDRCCTL